MNLRLDRGLTPGLPGQREQDPSVKSSFELVMLGRSRWGGGLSPHKGVEGQGSG